MDAPNIESTMTPEQLAVYRKWVASFGEGPAAIWRVAIEHIELRERCERLEAVLRSLRHHESCQSRWIGTTPRKCDCGIEAALAPPAGKMQS